MIENEKEDVIESLKLVQSMSLKAAIDGDYKTVAGLEVIKNCLWINRELTIERLERCLRK